MSYLRQQAGEDTDVIKGIGFDETLDKKIGVTIIATGFEHKDPFKARQPKAEEKKEEPKIVMTLGVQGEEKKLYTQPTLELEDKDPFAPTLSEPETAGPVVMRHAQPIAAPEPVMLSLDEDEVPGEELSLEKDELNIHHSILDIQYSTETSNTENQTSNIDKVHFELMPEVSEPVVDVTIQQPTFSQPEIKENIEMPPVNKSSGFLARPSNIYAETGLKSNQNPMEAKPSTPIIEEQPELEMTLVLKDEIPETADEVKQPQPIVQTQSVEDSALQNDADDQKRRAAERIQKLRNLSFNINAADPNNEFEAVPAYVRRNMEMFGNTLTSVENFYSKYTVKTDENNQTQISTINTFLEGKKPD
jgi:cell division protein FtsZ